MPELKGTKNYCNGVSKSVPANRSISIRGSADLIIFDDDVFSLVRESWHSYASNRETLPAGLVICSAVK